MFYKISTICTMLYWKRKCLIKPPPCAQYCTESKHLLTKPSPFAQWYTKPLFFLHKSICLWKIWWHTKVYLFWLSISKDIRVWSFMKFKNHDVTIADYFFSAYKAQCSYCVKRWRDVVCSLLFLFFRFMFYCCILCLFFCKRENIVYV